MNSLINELQVLVYSCFFFFTPKTVTIEPAEFELNPGQSRQITLQFRAPIGANPALLPIYSGFIYATNSNTGETVHLSCRNSFSLCFFCSLCQHPMLLS